MERNGKTAQAFSEDRMPQEIEEQDEVQRQEASADKNEKPSPSPTASEEELARITAERDGLVDRLARIQAEFDNARKRGAKESLEYRDRAVADLVSQLLPVVDNFDLALRSDSPPEKLRQGVELIRRQLDEIL